MNRRQSKKLACRLAAGAIESNLGAGWPFEMIDNVDCEWSESDQDRILEALRDLVAELAERGGTK